MTFVNYPNLNYAKMTFTFYVLLSMLRYELNNLELKKMLYLYLYYVVSTSSKTLVKNLQTP